MDKYQARKRVACARTESVCLQDYLSCYVRQFAQYFVSDASLEKPLGNINSIDFDKNGKPDDAYGVSYIGLDSEREKAGLLAAWGASNPFQMRVSWAKEAR